MSKQRFSNNRKSRENRRTAGFTMTEILLVVAILAVLFGVTAVGLVQMQKELRQKELDSKAETIYMVAQNRLTELAASGRSDLYDPAKQGNNILPLGIMPSDSEIDRDEASLYYVSSAQLGEKSAAQALMPTSRIDKALRDADWVIEFDPASGSVYAVFYSESSMMNYQPKEFNSLRSKQRRLKAGAAVGYYGGDAVVTLDTGTLQTEIRVINEECLHAILSCYAPDGKDLNLTFRIKISDTFGNSVIQTVEPKPIANKRWAYDLMLDKLTAGNRFHEVYPKLVPGSDLTIRFRAISANAMIDAGSAEAVTNSLFASVQNGTAEILYGRHLQNLDTASGINAPEAKLKITEAVQRSHLHFEDVVDNDEDWYSLYGAKAYKPIDNPSLMRYTGSYQLSGSGAAEGEQVRCVIYGLQTDKGGMFDTFYGESLCDVTLSGAAITGGEHAGALAATIRSKNGTTVQGCRVYLSDAEGDLTGKTEKDVRIKGSTYVGGLVGYAACELHIRDSFAATVIGGAPSTYVGGLVGYAHDTIEISGSYADCYLYGQHVGGLIGGAAKRDSSFENCYAAGYIYAQKTAAGFLPQAAAHIKNAYAVIKYDNAADAKAYATVSACEDAKELYYIADGGVSRDVGEAVRYETLSKRDTFAKKLGAAFSATTGGDHTFAYNLMKQGLTDYSFPKLAKLAHYGDWAADFQDETPVYYEAYENGSYGIFGANLDTLHKEGTAVGDGYGIIYRTKPENAVTVQYCQKDGKPKESVTLQPAAAVKLTVGTETYYLLPFAKKIVNTTYAPADFYQPLVIDGTTYYYNPHFACTLTTEKPSQAAALVRIRTARQLHALSRYYEKYAKKTKRSVYMQGLDIDYAAYDWTTYTDVNHVSEQEPIGAGKTYVFDATYDGSGCTISGISFVNKREGSYDTGMFGDNRGILRNIAIVSEYTGGQDSYIGFGSNIAGGKAVAYGGVLAGRNSRTIRNCAAAGYTMTLYTYRNSTVCVGGLVGSNYGTIRECAAETPRIKLSATYANVKLGGFVGQNNGGISSCYAVADIEVMESRQGSVSTAGFAGENLGVVNTAYCTAAVVTAGSAKGYGFAPRGGTVKRCYYLNGGSYFYIEKLKAYHTENRDINVKAVTGDELQALILSGRFAKAKHTAYHQKTDAGADAKYPYPAVVRRDNKLVHYGNWVTEAQLGTMGMLYWEHEVGGSNAGYHFRYIGIQGKSGVSGSSLCSAHDDGGIVKAFGYGYYYKNDGTAATLEMEDAFAKPVAVDETASQALAAQINGYTFRLYTTGTTGESQLYLQENQANGTWTLSMGGAVHQFTLSPFFANAFSYDGCMKNGALQKPQDSAPFGEQTQPPGSKDNPYQIRSAMQLQYINWNAKNHNTQTAVSATSKRNVWSGDEQNTYFPYLVYVSGNDQSTKAYNYYWEQSHDLDYEGKKDGKPFHPIGSMYYTADNQKGQAYIAYFGGSYDGRTYAVKNLEIHADVNMVGLFGVTAGARLQNIVLYSEQDNAIEITDKSNRWYCIGGLVGFAAKGNNKAAQIENCTVSGYKILVSRTADGGWGGGSVGGLAGASNMDLSKCTAVNDIVVSATYNKGYQNIRVGGLVGNLRATVNGAYCGGSIHSTMQYHGKYPRVNTSVWVGGISGGIVMITYGMANLVGPTDGDVLVKNSYTYVELPASGDHQIQSSHAIASNGEMQHTDFGKVTNPSIRIENCYAYEESVRRTDDYNYKNKQDYWNGKKPLNMGNVGENSGRDIRLDNGGTSPYVTYQQLSDQGDNGVKAWLNAKGAAFSFVTTTENGASIDGKYSYAGSDTALEGKNYPFPTVLTQTDTLGRTVCVHYGRWVKGDLYWVGAMQSLDLLDTYDAATKTAAFTLQLKRTKMTDTQEPVYSFIDEDGQEVASDDSILEVISSTWQADKKAYAVTLRARRAGSMILRARMGDTDAFADVLLNLTAKISLLADPAEIDLSVNAEKEVTLQATSASGKKDLTADITPKIEVDDESIAWAEEPIYDKDKNVWKVKVKGIAAGDTRMSITASYKMTLGTQELEFSERTVVLINVTEATEPPEPPAPPESGTGPAVPPEGSTEPAKPPEGGNAAGTEPDGT